MKGYLTPQLDFPYETAQFKRPGWVEQPGLAIECCLNLRPFTFPTLCRIPIIRIRLTMKTVVCDENRLAALLIDYAAITST